MEAVVWRVLTPLVLLVVSAGVAYEGRDGDGDFYVFPLIEQIPGVADSPVARADASAAVLVAVALLVIVMNLRHGAKRNLDPDA